MARPPSQNDGESGSPHVGHAFRRWREAIRDPSTGRVLSQERAARLIGVSTATYSRWERGETDDISASYAPAIADALQRPTSEVLTLLGIPADAQRSGTDDVASVPRSTSAHQRWAERPMSVETGGGSIETEASALKKLLLGAGINPAGVSDPVKALKQRWLENETAESPGDADAWLEFCLRVMVPQPPPPPSDPDTRDHGDDVQSA